MQRPLEGVTVVEVSAWAFVPSAGAVLADWGAEVIKIEPPEGDPMRGLISGGVGFGPSFPWEIWNRNKRSLGVDLTNEAGRDLVLRLAANADVFLTSYLPDVRAKLGIDIDDIKAVNPNIVYAIGSGYGPEGDEASRGGFDAISFWARSGAAIGSSPIDSELTGNQPSGAFGDSISGMALAGGISAALLRKERTGVGATVDVSLLGTSMWTMQMSIAASALIKMLTPPDQTPVMPTTIATNPLVNNYQTQDGRWLALCMLQRDRYWDGLMDVIGRSELKTDERFADGDARNAHLAEAIAELTTTFLKHPLSHWREALGKQDGQWDVATTVFELVDDAQARANGYVTTIDYDGFAMPMVSSPAQIDRRPPDLGPAPDFNGDVFEVLGRLGLSADDIVQLQIDGALA